MACRDRTRATRSTGTPLGEVAPTGRPVDIVTIEVLTVAADGRICDIRVLADELGLLTRLDAVTLKALGGRASRLTGP